MSNSSFENKFNIAIDEDEHNNNPNGVESDGETIPVRYPWEGLDPRDNGKKKSLYVNEFQDEVTSYLVSLLDKKHGVTTSKSDLLKRLLQKSSQNLAKRLENGEPYQDLL